MSRISRLVILLLIVLLSILLVGCGASDKDDGTGTDNVDSGETDNEEQTDDEKQDQDNDMTQEKYYNSIITGDLGGADLDLRTLISAYQKKHSKRLAVKALSSELPSDAIILGECDLEITKSALDAMKKYRTESHLGVFDLAYSIYSADGLVAVVWEHPEAAVKALEKLKELITAEKELADGIGFVAHTAMCADMIEAERDERNAALDTLASELGEGVRNAAAAHLSLATENYYVWLASLYKPRKCVCNTYDADGYRICQLPKDENGKYLCTGGGFYYSCSARDTDGYEIDLESTIQAMSFAVASGMLKKMSDFDRQIGLDAIAFAKSLQSPEDGYFYHPQWGRSITDSRKGRDLDWATKIFTNFGGVPLYDTPSGLSGSLGAAGALTGSLKTSGAVAASRVVGAAHVWPDHLTDLAAFSSYLSSFDLKNSSYSAGNTFTAQASQILNRDKEGIATGEFTDTDGDGIADNGFVMTFKSYLDSKQNPENGLWEDLVHYDSVNGLMKIGSAYNKLGIEIPNPEAAFASAAEVIAIEPDSKDCKGRIASAAVDVFNPWIAIIELLNNIRSFGDLDNVERMKNILKADAEKMIRITTEKTKKFAKPDGSFGYTWATSPYKSQGAPVCPEGIVEGDVNGGGIALNGIWMRIAAALDIPISIFSPSDGIKFAYLLEKQMKNAK